MNPCAVCCREGIATCGECEKTVYCSVECQARDWKEGHHEICGIAMMDMGARILSKTQKKASHSLGEIDVEIHGETYTFDVSLFDSSKMTETGEDYDVVYGRKVSRIYMIRPLVEPFETLDKAQLRQDAEDRIRAIYTGSVDKYAVLRRASDYQRTLLTTQREKKSIYIHTFDLPLNGIDYTFRVYVTNDGRQNRTDYAVNTGPVFTGFYLVLSEKKYLKYLKYEKTEKKEKVIKKAKKIILRVYKTEASRVLLEAKVDYSKPPVELCRVMLENAFDSTPESAVGLFLTRSLYSARNTLVLLHQMMARGVQPTSCYSMTQWRTFFGNDTRIKKGERAYSIIMPTNSAQKKGNKPMVPVDEDHLIFRARAVAYTQSQTTAEHKITPLPPLKGFDYKMAADTFGIKMLAWDIAVGTDTNVSHRSCAGFSEGKSMTINMDAEDKEGVFFHEIAHIVLGHTGNMDPQGLELTESEQEMEAESTAILCKKFLGLTNISDNVKYVREWQSGNLTVEMYFRIARATQKILDAGRTDPALDMVDTIDTQ